MILILDYGASNLRSVQKAFDYLRIPATVSDDARMIANADKIILPGVGAFGQGINAVRSRGFDSAIGEHIAKQKPLLGICLGMQLLLSESEEMGVHQGLNFISGKVQQFNSQYAKVPQIGWNNLHEIRRESLLFKGIDDGTYFYFVHSYFCNVYDADAVSAKASYAQENFAVAIEKNGIFAVQFHPEKSGTAGLKVLENFARL
ncbi:MAG: imidazole glycerol phosphate synthase subunit HisH [Chloroherpetonaceae bacterium]